MYTIFTRHLHTARQPLPSLYGRGQGWVCWCWAFLFIPLFASAQEFTQLNWDELRIDSVLPVYSEVVPLETDASKYDYRVRVLYPEWAPLTKAEQAVAEREKERLSDTLQIDPFVAYSRGQAMLDYYFIPVIYREGKYLKLLSGKIVIETITKTGTARRIRKADEASETRQRWADNSVLATGKWVRITLTDDGLYRLPYSTLRSMGFTSPENIRVYGYGGHRQKEKIFADTDWDDLEPVALLSTDDGYVFHANGLMTWRNGVHVRNHYARVASYFVTEASTPVETMEKVDMSAEASALGIGESVSSFTANAVHDPQEYAWFQGGNQLYEDYDYALGNTRSYTLKLPTYTVSGSTSTFYVNFTAASDVETQVTPTVNGTELTPFSVPRLTDYSYAMEKSRRFTKLDEPLATTTVQFTTTSGQSARLNYFELTYEGAMRIDASIPVIQFAHSSNYNAGEFSIQYAEGQDPHLWRLAEPNSPAVELVGTATEKDGKLVYTVPVVNDGEEHRYVVFDANVLSSLPIPTVAGDVANQNLHATDSLDMVIITPASGIFDSEAERLAEAHRQIDGLRVGVFRADQIYNEFSSGTPDATAYRRFMKMIYDRTEDKVADAPRYLLLFGDAAWDNRMLTVAWRNYNPDNFLLCYESDNSFNDVSCYVMEDYFGLLDDGEGSVLTREKVDVGVGRFPVRSVAEARALVNKTISYMKQENAGAWKNIVVFLGDDGDANNHLAHADAVATSVERKHPELEVRKVMWDAYTREISSTGNRYPDVERIIDDQISEGALMFNYTGHAAPYCLSHEQVLRIEDFAAMNSPRTPLWVTAACDVMPFDSQKDNIGETAILNEKVGIVAFFGTSRTVYADKNKDLNLLFCDEIFDADELGRPNYLGDAVRLSKARLAATEGTYPQNKIHFALLGDPALRFGSHGNRIVLDSINGQAVDALPEDFILHAGGKARLSGHLVDASGGEFTSFHGTLTAHLYDSKRTVTCLNNDRSASSPFTFEAYDKILYNGSDSVQGGRFTITCPIPLDISYSNDSGRLLFYALSNDLQTEANGYNDDFLLGGTEPGLSDTEGPIILAYLGNENFENGGTVSAQPFFVAQLEDESGINTAGTAVGHDLELIVDGDPSTTYNLNNYFTGEFGNYQRGVVSYTLPTLEAGQHSLLFRAWDTLGNPSTTTLDFVVDPSMKPNLLDLTTSVNPATTQTTFLLTYDRPGSTCDFTIEVYDYAGRLLWTHQESGSSERGVYAIPWDLTTGSGFPLWSGVYLYRAHVSCNGSSEATKAKKLIINRRQ